MATTADPSDTDLLEEFSKTAVVTQELKRDIINFLAAKHTGGATLTVAEIMAFYNCPEDRARRVIKSLVDTGTLKLSGPDTYRVMV